MNQKNRKEGRRRLRSLIQIFAFTISLNINSQSLSAPQWIGPIDEEKKAYIDLNSLKADGNIRWVTLSIIQDDGSRMTMTGGIECKKWMYAFRSSKGKASQWELIGVGTAAEMTAKIVCR